jgi:hypothetical protein
MGGGEKLTMATSNFIWSLLFYGQRGISPVQYQSEGVLAIP